MAHGKSTPNYLTLVSDDPLFPFSLNQCMVVLRPLRGGDSDAVDAQETSPSQAAFDAVQVIDASPFQFRSTKSHQASPCWPRSLCAGGHTQARRAGDERG